MKAQELRGRWNQVRGKLKEKWGQLTDDDLQWGEGNIEQIVGKIQQRTGEDRSKIEKFLDELSEEQPTGARTREYAQQGYDYAREQARRGVSRAQGMIHERPAESLTTVLVVGVAAGVLLGLMLWSE
jgi:uncharacterized protein YjbJ (UPF0337 family)